MRNIDYQKCGKYFSYIFWLLIPREIAGLMTNQRIGGSVPALLAAGTVISALCIAAEAYFLWQLKDQNEGYKTAAILYMAGAVVSVFSGLAARPSNNSIGLTILAGIANPAIGLAEVHFTNTAHSEVMSEPSPELSARWLQLRKYMFIAVGLTLGSLILLFIPVIAAFGALAGAIMTVVVSIMSLAALYRSAQVCKTYVPKQADIPGEL